MSEILPEGRHKVYLVKLCRITAEEAQKQRESNTYAFKDKFGKSLPNCVYKVGITKFKDAESRISFDGDNEHPIRNTFEVLQYQRSIQVENKNIALKLEKYIMDTVFKARAQILAREGHYVEHAFHNWFEPNKVDGITEMRRWNKAEVDLVRKILDQFDYSNSLFSIEESVRFLDEHA